ncbi:hypothetical protein DFJ77DRAFT_463294 [Powellomyces hirtus]|nr:hypothetical protein DFJ77DRAFT_463294 [Powellomyces hirtus]
MAEPAVRGRSLGKKASSPSARKSEILQMPSVDVGETGTSERPKRARSAYLSDEILLRESYGGIEAKRNSYLAPPRPATFAARSSRHRSNRLSTVAPAPVGDSGLQAVFFHGAGPFKSMPELDSPVGDTSTMNDNMLSRVNSFQTSFSSEDVLFTTASHRTSVADMSGCTDAMDTSVNLMTSPGASNNGDSNPSTPTLSHTASSESLPGSSKRAKIANEILQSERRYVDSLLQLRKSFFEPLMTVVGTASEVIPKKTIQSIFSELRGLINVNTELRKQLESRLDEQPWNSTNGCIGDIFLNLAPYLKMYSSYVKNFNNALSLLTENVAKVPALAQFIARQNADPELKGLPLESFLILPVQRIPRYKLLLEDLLKNTDSEHPDHLTLKKSLERIAEVAVFVNETIREHEMMQELVEVQRSLYGMDEDLVSPGRRLIKRGRVQKISRRRHHTRYLILLSDFLIYASPSMLEDHYTFHRKLDLELCEVVDVPDTKDMEHIFQIVSPEKSFAMYADSAKEKQKWIHDIDTAARELRTNRSTLRNEGGEEWSSWQKRRKMHNYSAPVWMPDDSTNCCMLCSQEFTMIKRKHHCRACGKIVCYACSDKHFLIPGLHKDTPARACDPCYERISREGKLQVVSQTQSMLLARRSFDIPKSTAPLLPLQQPQSSSGQNLRPPSRRVRPVSMAPQLWSTFAKKFLDEGVTRRTYAPSAGNGRRDSMLGTHSACSLCHATFSWMKWKYNCKTCGRVVCASCTPKTGQYDTCDPCHRGVDPEDIIVDPEGGGWSASPAMMEVDGAP